MKRLSRLALSVVVAFVLMAGISTVYAASPYWERGYPEKWSASCTVFIAQWSDGTYSWMPWTCPDLNEWFKEKGYPTVVRKYPERGGEGCTWNVIKMSDGSFIKFPVVCPSSVVLYKDGSIGRRGASVSATSSTSRAPQSPPPAQRQPVCDYSGTSQRVIKGNVSFDTGEQIYHVPGGRYYDSTVINENYGERWFCTEADAQAAGWRRSTY